MNSEPKTHAPRARPLRTARRLLTVGALLLAAVACAPGAAVLAPPTFTLDAARSGFVTIDPPGVGDGSALFRLALTVTNPNPVGVRLTGLDGDVYLQGSRAAAVAFRGGIDLPANRTAPLTLDVKVPLGAAPLLLEAVANLVVGQPVQYRVDAAVTTDVLGAPHRFPAFTLARGELTNPLVLVAPRLALTGGRLRFEAVNRVALSLEVELSNSGLIGYFVQVPELVLSVGGAEAGAATLGPVAVASGATVPVSLVFRFDPVALGAGVLAQVQAASAGAGGLSLQLSGAWRLEAPGVVTTALEPTALLRDVLR